MDHKGGALNRPESEIMSRNKYLKVIKSSKFCSACEGSNGPMHILTGGNPLEHLLQTMVLSKFTAQSDNII